MKKITVIGGGVSGKAAALLAQKQGDVPEIINDGDGVCLPADSHLIVVSPGVHPLRSPLYRDAAASGVERLCPMLLVPIMTDTILGLMLLR